MKISFHGGKCCGIKHIYDLGRNPEAKLGPLKSREYDGPDWSHDKKKNSDQWGLDVNSKTNCYDQGAPTETYLERLDRYLAFLAQWRPNGITEIVLCDYAETWAPQEHDQVVPWEPLLLERGFQLMTPGGVYNSNSKNRVYVYYLIRDKEDD